MGYKINIKHTARKDIRRLNEPLLGQVLLKIDELSENPRPSGCEQLAGNHKGKYKVRVREHRIIYRIDDTAKEVTILAVKPRGGAYD